MPEEAQELPGRDGLGELIGIEYQEIGAEEVRARVEVTDDIRQPVGARARWGLRGSGREHLLGSHLAGGPR